MGTRRGKLGLIWVMAGTMALAAPGDRTRPEIASWVGEFPSRNAEVRVERLPGGTRVLTLTRHSTRGMLTERDFDLAGQGVADVKEVSLPPYLVRYRVPSPRGYLRVTAEKRTRRGFIDADFVLSQDGRRYVLLSRVFRPFRIDFDSDGSSCDRDDGTAQPGAPQAPALGSSLEQITDTVNKSRILGPSCKGRTRQTLRAGIAKVVNPKESANLISCMSRHHAGYYGAKLDETFESMLAPNAPPAIACSVAQGKYAAGSSNDANGMITLSTDIAGGTGSTDPGAVFFHESLHKAGIKDEQLVRQIVACCYGPQAQCKGNGAIIDQKMEEADDVTARATAAARNLDGFTALYKKMAAAADPTRADTFMQNFFDQLGSSTGDGSSAKALMSAYRQCASQKQPNCTQNFVAGLEKNIESYFDADSNCAMTFGGPTHDPAVCKDLLETADQMIQENATHACGTNASAGKAVSSLPQSCLATESQSAKSLFAYLQTENGNRPDTSRDKSLVGPLAASVGTAGELNDNQKEFVAYMTGFTRYLGASAWIDLRTMTNQVPSDTVIAMMDHLFGTLTQNGWTQKLQQSLASCEKGGGSQQQCGQRVFGNVQNGISAFFKNVCPTYVTQSEDASTVCPKFSAAVLKSITFDVSNATKGCAKNAASQSAALIAGNYDFNCLVDAVTLGTQYAANYDQDCGGANAKKNGCATGALSDLWMTGNPVKDRQIANQAASSVQPVLGDAGSSAQYSVNLGYGGAGFPSAAPVAAAQAAQAAPDPAGFENTARNVLSQVSNLGESSAQAATTASFDGSSTVVTSESSRTTVSIPSVELAPQTLAQWPQGSGDDASPYRVSGPSQAGSLPPSTAESGALPPDRSPASDESRGSASAAIPGPGAAAGAGSGSGVARRGFSSGPASLTASQSRESADPVMQAATRVADALQADSDPRTALGAAGPYQRYIAVVEGSTRLGARVPRLIVRKAGPGEAVTIEAGPAGGGP